jgi:hypothetical protein
MSLFSPFNGANNVKEKQRKQMKTLRCASSFNLFIFCQILNKMNETQQLLGKSKSEENTSHLHYDLNSKRKVMTESK